MSAAHNFNGDTYMPLVLKGVLMRHGITQNDFARAIKQKSGNPLSFAAVSLILNWDHWPKSTSREHLQRQTEALLRAYNVPEEEIATVWNEDANDNRANRAPHAPALSLVTKPLDLEPLETEMLSPNAKKHFSIFRDPFGDDVQGPEDVYLSPDNRYIREAMLSAAKHGGFLAVIGESGAGKSVLRKDLLDRITRDSHSIVVVQPRAIDKSRLTTSHIFEAIISDLSPGAQIKQSYEGKSRQAEILLRDSSRAGNTHVLLIEESHDLSIATLKSLKRFWELEDGFKRLLSIILIGQPEMKVKLNEQTNPAAREVIRRCEVAELMPLDKHLEAYLALKFKRVGKETGEVFGADAFDAMRRRLTERRMGVYPLIVNNLVTKAMNLAAEIGAGTIGADVIKEL